MDQPDVDENAERVILNWDGSIMVWKRPRGVSPSQWLNFWERVDRINRGHR
jgi:hypothetical protein